ncbi:MAG: alpha/beta hydrolase [Pirellulales bacterium]
MLVCVGLAADKPQTSCTRFRPQDQLWLVSNRGLGCDVEHQFENLKYWRYDPEKRWVRSNLAKLKGADKPHLTTTIFVHGNRVTSSEAFTDGLATYRALVRCANEQPIRFIIWSWPSEPIDGVVDDARIKAARTTPAAYQLAWFVDRLDAQGSVGFWAHSFGARIVTGALHLLGGGRLGGYRPLARIHESRESMQVVLVAAALDNDWLLESRAHGHAMSQVDRMLLVNNSCDVALKRYHWIYDRRACQQALGYTGLSGGRVEGNARGKIVQLDACCQIGRDHMLAGYLCARGLMARMRNQLLLEPSGEPRASNETVAKTTPRAAQ